MVIQKQSSKPLAHGSLIFKGEENRCFNELLKNKIGERQSRSRVLKLFAHGWGGIVPRLQLLLTLEPKVRQKFRSVKLTNGLGTSQRSETRTYRRSYQQAIRC